MTREDDYGKKSGRAGIWMLLIPPSHYQQSSVGARWNLMSQLDPKSSVLTEGSTNFMRMWVNHYGNGLLSKHFGFLLLRLFLAVSSAHAHTPLTFPHTWAARAPHWKLGGCGHRGLYLQGWRSELAPSRLCSFHYYLRAMENRQGQEVYSIMALTLLLKKDHRSGETRQLRALASLKEDLSQCPASTLEESQPAVGNSLFRGIPFLWPL